MRSRSWSVLTVLFSSLVVSGCERRDETSQVTRSNSMSPTIVRGDQVTFSTDAYKAVGDVKRWDIIVFRYAPRYQEPNGSAQGGPVQTYVKRVVALPGEKLQYSKSRITIDGEPLEIPASLRFLGTIYSDKVLELAESENVTIPASGLFIVGDNIHNSRDSRLFGPIDFSDVIGRVTRVNGKQLSRSSSAQTGHP